MIDFSVNLWQALEYLLIFDIMGVIFGLGLRKFHFHYQIDIKILSAEASLWKIGIGG